MNKNVNTPSALPEEETYPATDAVPEGLAIQSVYLVKNRLIL
jgi:hypothetical protein